MIDPLINNCVIGLMGAVFGTLVLGMGSLIDAKYKRATTGAMDAAEQGRKAGEALMKTPAGRLFLLVLTVYLLVIAFTIAYSPLRMNAAWFFGGLVGVPFAAGFLSALIPASLRARCFHLLNLPD